MKSNVDESMLHNRYVVSELTIELLQFVSTFSRDNLVELEENCLLQLLKEHRFLLCNNKKQKR